MAGFTKEKQESPLAAERRRHKAEKVLGIQRGETYDAGKVRQRYTSIVKAHHPDASGQHTEFVPEHSLDDLRKAKDELLKQLGADND